MNCKEFQDKLLEPTALAGLDQDQEASEHATVCAECSRAVEWNRKIAGGFSAMIEREPPAVLKDRVMSIPEMIGSPEASAKPEKVSEPSGSPGFPGWRWLTGMGLSFAGAFLLYVAVLRPSDSSVPRSTDTRPPIVEMAVSAPQTPPVISTTSGDQAPQNVQVRDLKQADNPPPILLAGGGTSSGQHSGVAVLSSTPDTTVPGDKALVRASTEAFQVALGPSETMKATLPEPADDPKKTVLAFVPPPPKVVGEPLNSTPAVSAVAATPSPIRADGNPPASIVLAKVSKSGLAGKASEEQKSGFMDGEVLLREAEPETANAKEISSDLRLDEPLIDGTAVNEQFAEDFREKKSETASMRQMRKALRVSDNQPPTTTREEAPAKSLPDLENRRERVLALVIKHSDKIVEGPIDLNQWILAGWITVRERLSLSAPSGKTWLARQESGNWKVDMESFGSR